MPELASVGPSASATFLGALRLGMRSMWRRPFLAIAFLGSTLIQGALQGLLIWVLRDVLETFGRGGDLTTKILLVNGSLVLGVWLLRSFSSFAAETLAVFLSHRVEVVSMLEVLAKLLRLSVRFFDRNSQADVVMASYHDLKGIRAVTLEVGKVVLYLSQLLGLAVAAWMMSPKLAFIGFIAVPLGILPVYWFGQEITRAARGEREAVVTLYQSFFQVASAIRVIKVSLSEERVLRRAGEIAQKLHGYLVRQAMQRGFARLLLETVSGFGLVIVLTVGGFDVASGRLPWQALLGLLVAMMAVFSPVVGLVQLYGNIRTIIPNLDRIDAILREPVEIQDRPNAHALQVPPSLIELRAVSFSHGNRRVLTAVSGSFRRGERIGIVGPSGAGKTTLLSLLLRFYDPESGSIHLDGVDLRETRHRDWMRYTAIVLQEPILFVDTIASNIRMGRPDATLEQVMAAAAAANIHDEISAMEQGYDTVIGVGRDARGISTGQKQRICIAAALLKDAPVLFLDEATSSLDSVSERKVQTAIERLMEGRTTFVVAHRFSTLRTVDRILVLEAGHQIGLGPHAELLRTCPTYRVLWEAQDPSPPSLPASPATYAAAGNG